MRPESKIGIALLLLAACLPAQGQYDGTVQDARSGALGGIVSFEPDSGVATLSYRQGFLMAELATRQVHLQMPTGRLGTAGLFYCHQGNADLHIQQVAAAYALRVAERVHVGVAARWVHQGSGDVHYDTRQWISPSVLARVEMQKTVLMLWGGTRPWDAVRRWRMHLQASYRPTRDVMTVVELENESRWRLRMGMEYVFSGCVKVRAGLSTGPLTPSCGIGFRWRRMAIDMASEWHPTLGITPQLSLSVLL